MHAKRADGLVATLAGNTATLIRVFVAGAIYLGAIRAINMASGICAGAIFVIAHEPARYPTVVLDMRGAPFESPLFGMNSG